jgi:hypothetical protein
MPNEDLREQLEALESAAADLRKAVAAGAPLPAMALASALVKLSKMTADLGRVGDKVRAALAAGAGKRADAAAAKR